MKIKFLGTAAAEGIPGLFCKCNTCIEARKRGGKNIRSRSQAVIDGKLLIDFPADTLWHTIEHNVELADIRHCLVTHSHSDHLYPSDVYMRVPGFSSLGTAEDEKFHFYGSNGVMRKINSYMASVCLDHRDFIGTNVLEEYKEYSVGDYKVIPLEALHDITSAPFIYIIKAPDGKTLLYGNDTNYFPERVWEFIKNNDLHFDLVSLDCTDGCIENRTYIGHMNLADNIKVKEKLIALGKADEKTVFCSNHFSHNGISVLYEEFSQIAAKSGFLTTYDGMEIEF